MKHLKDEITNYMNDWEECSKCYDMFKFSRLTCTNEDTLICDECVEEDIMCNWIS